ncbi:prenyltransferase [Nocardioides caldifontis]|uniref:prenyltransferase n=1 Tax=Nocardioides caldifontis TaxID=2588938 RepID=UPI0011DF5F79|nr:prenyltransferase [Nocardioides caldifontis]
MSAASPVPELPGVLTAAQVRETAAAVVRVQQPDGGIPWAVGEHIDVWNHVEAAMALLVAGEVEAAEAAYEWVRRRQRADGTWPMKIIGEAVEDDAAEANMCAYLAVGVWHHWLVRRDSGFVERFWPVVRRALDFVASMQAPFGGISWSREADGTLREDGGALLAGSSSIYHSFRAGLSLAGLVQQPQPDWEVVAGGLRHALEAHRDQFMDKSTFSMDWYYPVLGGPVRGREAAEMFERRWDDFVVDGLGCRCVDTNPWVTGAETCELVLALDNVGDRDRALRLFTDIQHSRHESGLYWTGYVFPEGVWWPNEQTTYTSAAVILAADALSSTTPGAGIFRGDALTAEPRPMPLQCGCGESVVSRSSGR